MKIIQLLKENGNFNNVDEYSSVDISQYIKSTTQKIQGSNIKRDANNNSDIGNKKTDKFS